MSEQSNPRIDERYDLKFTLLMLFCLLLVIGCGVIIGLLGPKAFSAEMLLILKILLIVSLVTTLVLLLRSLVCRICIDESGASVDNPFTGHSSLPWNTIRSAAIVYLAVGTQTSAPIILLSTRTPEETLTRRALMSPRLLPRTEHVRIPFTPARRTCVEHYLNMKLAEFHL